MKAPKYIATFVCSLMVFAILQGFLWHWRPEPGWQPAWWQSHAWATLGFILSLPAMLPDVILGDLGVTNAVLWWLGIAFGFIAEFVLVYCSVYFPAKYLFRHSRRVEPAKTAA